MHILASLVAAFGPTVLYTLLLWWLDRHEKEPIHLLIVTFVWGALPALLLALVAELAVGARAVDLLGPGADTTVVAPVVEEPLKALALIGIFLFARREFNGVLDGIIYGALVGFGFAMSENVLYFVRYHDQLVTVWLFRAVLFGLNHAFFTSMVGIALGLVRYERRRWVGYITVPIALWLAVLLHGLHNMSAQLGPLGLCLAWIVNSGGVVVVLATAALSQRHELSWLNAELDEELARGVISLPQYERLINPSLRSKVEARTLITRGWLHYRRLRRFHHLLTELAFVKHQLRQGDRYCCQADVVALRGAVLAARRLIDEPAPHHAVPS